MKRLRQTSTYKKDIKRYLHDYKKLAQLNVVLDMLREEMPLPSSYNPHFLKGDYEGFVECHIGSDFLLIWIDETSDVIALARLGSHAELFGKGAKR